MKDKDSQDMPDMDKPLDVDAFWPPTLLRLAWEAVFCKVSVNPGRPEKTLN